MPIRSLRSIVSGQDPLLVPASLVVTETARLMRERNFGAAMVVEGSRLVGIFTERDALFRVLAERRDPFVTPVGQVMTRDPQSLHPDRPFDEALCVMFQGHFRHVPVVEHGRPLGMVSVRDALDEDFREARDALDLREMPRD